MASNEVGQLAPFFVVDRPISLEILSGLDIPRGAKLGLMAHANTSALFERTLKAFPCTNKQACPVLGGAPCPHDGNLSKCAAGRAYRQHFTFMADSGVFTKEGAALADYNALFAKYESMGVEYGVILDVLKDPEATIASAEEAFRIYQERDRPFKLVGVAQGNNVTEYLHCYRRLKQIGYTHVAIGGMLTKKEASARYVHVTDEALLESTIHSIRKEDPNGWLFALGCYHPRRHDLMRANHIVGSDYKGWIFQYTTKSPKRGDLTARAKRFAEVRGFIANEILSRNQAWGRRRLLIMACTKAKQEGIHPAVDLYDGPSFKVLRRRPPSGLPEPMDVVILSAKHGLVQAHTRIGHYDRKLTPARRQRLQKRVELDLHCMISRGRYSEIIVHGGREYQLLIQGALGAIDGAPTVHVHDGPIGIKLAQLRQLLERPQDAMSPSSPPATIVA